MKKSLDYLALILLCSQNTATGLFFCFFLCVIGGLTVPLFRENIPGLRLPGTGIYSFNSFTFPSYQPRKIPSQKFAHSWCSFVSDRQAPDGIPAIDFRDESEPPH